LSRSANDRRSSPRKRLSITGSNPVIVTAGIVPRAVLVSDLSPEGMGLLATFAPPIESVLPVWLPGRPGEPSVLALLQVVHVQPAVEGLHLIGTASHDESSTSALRQFQARLVAESGQSAG
jgi:hypothetical protein